MFKGHSYTAISKLEKFIDSIESSDNITQKLSLSIRKNTLISEEICQLIDQKINEIFMIS